MRKPAYDDYGYPLCQSGVAEHVWELYSTDLETFKRRVYKHFSLGMPGWTPVRVNYKDRIIWLRDDRGQSG